MKSIDMKSVNKLHPDLRTKLIAWCLTPPPKKEPIDRPYLQGLIVGFSFGLIAGMGTIIMVLP